jgi:hypothetical protein
MSGTSFTTVDADDHRPGQDGGQASAFAVASAVAEAIAGQVSATGDRFGLSDAPVAWLTREGKIVDGQLLFI